MKKKLLIAIVDKDMDSEHSFIKNFLITKQKFFKVILLCETLSSNKIFKSNNNYILPILKKRKFLNRLYNFCRIFLFLKQYKKENKGRIERIEVFLAFDGLQAFKERQSKYCNIIFMDDQMPQINGFESLNYIEQFIKNKKNKLGLDPMLFEPSMIVMMADRGNHAEE